MRHLDVPRPWISYRPPDIAIHIGQQTCILPTLQEINSIVLIAFIQILCIPVFASAQNKNISVRPE
jgi:hypothetical protein